VSARRIALLRSVNLGRSRRVSMAELRELLDDHGYAGVRTHQQSGNVVLTSDAPPKRLERELAALIEAELGLKEARVAVRTRDELADVIARNPLAEVADDPRRLQVSFFSSPPGAGVIARLEEATAEPERFAVSGREIYAWHPNGINDSPLAKALGHPRLGATARNWNTVTKLLALADG
jgi:uncharacterized protein (DUF1697 family)